MTNKLIPYILIGAAVGISVFYYQKYKYENLSVEDLPSVNEVVTKTIDKVTEGSGIEDYANKGLTEFPKALLSRLFTVKLDLSGNNITTLPSEIGKLTNLQELYIVDTGLRSLPGEIRMFTKLRILDVHNNELTGIPAEIGQLPAIEKLDFSNNRITDLPNEIFKLGHLDELNLTGNPISEDKIEELKSKLPSTEIKF